MAVGSVHFFDASRFLSSTGASEGGTVFFYYSGTTNLAPIYEDQALTVPKANPVEVAVGQVLPKIYLDPKITYRRRVVFTTDGTFHDQDPIPLSLESFVEEITGQAGRADAAAQAAEDSANRAESVALVEGAYPNAYAGTTTTNLPKGVTSIAITAAGTGFTNGTYALGVSGGPSGFAGTYTVTGGTVTSTTITNPGLSTATAAPTLTFPSGGGTGATATATVSGLVPAGAVYWAVDSNSRALLLYRNNNGTPAAENMPNGLQVALPLRSMTDEALLAHSPLQDSAVLVSKPELRRILDVHMYSDVPELAVQWCVRDSGGARLILRLAEIAAPANVYYAHVFGANPDPSTDPLLQGGVGKVTMKLIGPTSGNIAGEILYDFGDGSVHGTATAITLSTSKLSEDAIRLTDGKRAEIKNIVDETLAAEIDTSTFDVTATNLDNYLGRIVKKIVLFNAKSHDYRISFAQTSSTNFVIDVWDEVLGGPVGFFQVSDPNYGLLPERIPLVATNRIPGIWPATTGHSGLEGYLQLRGENVVVSGAAFNYTDPVVSRIARKNITKRYQYSNRHWADDFQEVIQFGPTRPLTGLRDTLTSLYLGGALSNQDNPSQLPICARANPLYRIALVADPGTYLGVSEHMPDWVYIGGLHRDDTIFEHSPGATRSVFEGHANTGAFDCTIRNTMPEGGGGSARYGWHMDFAHLLNAPDSKGDFNRWYTNMFKRVRFIVGPNAQVQTYGSGIGTHAEAVFEDCEFLCENGSYGGPLASANNSSGTVGGGRFTFKNCWDRSGRGSTTSTVAVQTKTDSTYPNYLTIDGCRGFQHVSLSPGSLGNFVGKWLLTGNNNITAANITSTIPGDTLGV